MLGSYAEAFAAADPRTEILLFNDHNLAVPRTAFVPRESASPEAGAAFIRFLLSPEGQDALARAPGLAPLTGPAWLSDRQRDGLLPLQQRPGMRLWQDRMKHGAGATTFLLTVTALLPLYAHLGMSRHLMLLLLATCAGMVNMLS